MSENFDYSYDKMDPIKKRALEVFRPTFSHSDRLGIRVMPAGDTAAVLDFMDYDFMIAFNVEGLGTKNMISDAMYRELKEKAAVGTETKTASMYRTIGQDTVATLVKDLLAVGADPMVYGDFLTAGADSWFEDMERIDELPEGYKIAADIVGCAIPLGETPTLPGIVNPETLVLEGASIGLIRPKERYISGQKLTEGDIIYGVRSSGLHANGISKTRKIASRLQEGFFTRLPDGKTYGEHLLVPTELRDVRAIHEMMDEGTDIHMLQPITGHGWRKIARSRRPFLYQLDEIPEPHLVFEQMIEWGRHHSDIDVTNQINYETWNMGLGYVIIAPDSSESTIRRVGEAHELQIYKLGVVRKSPDDGKKIVRIEPVNVTYTDLAT